MSVCACRLVEVAVSNVDQHIGAGLQALASAGCRNLQNNMIKHDINTLSKHM
jgi:hypothetical protein